MNGTWIVLTTFGVTTLFACGTLSFIYETCFRYRLSVRERIKSMGLKAGSGPANSLLDVKRLANSSAGAQGDWWTSTQAFIRQAGLKADVGSILTLSAALGVAGGGVLAVGRWWWLIPFAALAGAAAPWMVIYLKRRARIQAMMRQLPEVLEIICRAVRAGQTLPAAFQIVADDFAPPISEEFRSCYEQQNLGLSYESSLRNLARSSGIMELRILVVALLVQSRSGGNLTELLGNLATVLRKRLVMQQKVQALTGEGRLQATVLIALPFLVFAALYVLNRPYAQILLDRPWLLGGCMLSQLIGALCIRKIIRIDY